MICIFFQVTPGKKIENYFFPVKVQTKAMESVSTEIFAENADDSQFIQNFIQ